jgi:hypothetical protein
MTMLTLKPFFRIQKALKILVLGSLISLDLYITWMLIGITLKGKPGNLIIQAIAPLLAERKIGLLPSFQIINLIPLLGSADSATALFQYSNLLFLVAGVLAVTATTVGIGVYLVSIDIPSRVARHLNVIAAKRALKLSYRLHKEISRIYLHDVPAPVAIPLAAIHGALTAHLYEASITSMEVELLKQP